MKKAYIAGPIFTPEQLEVIEKIIACIPDEWDYFSSYHASQPIWLGRAPKNCSVEDRDKVVRQNRENLENSDVVICWLNGRFPDGRTDTGVVWEMGYATAQANFNGAGDDSVPHPALIGFLNREFAMPKDLNLMLTGTLDGLVDTYANLQTAIDYVDSGMLTSVWDEFNPQHFDMAEQEITGGVRAVTPQGPSPDNRHAMLGRPSPGQLHAHNAPGPNREPYGQVGAHHDGHDTESGAKFPGRSGHTSDPH